MSGSTRYTILTGTVPQSSARMRWSARVGDRETQLLVGPRFYAPTEKQARKKAEAYLARMTASSRDAPRRRSKTREEWIASLRWNIKDAKEALKNAVDMGDWNAVEKYTRQIKTMEPRLYRTEGGQLGVRRAGRARMVREEESRRQAARYQERVREVEKRLRGQGFTGHVKDYAETLIATRGYDQRLLSSIPHMTPRRIRGGEDD